MTETKQMEDTALGEGTPSEETASEDKKPVKRRATRKTTSTSTKDAGDELDAKDMPEGDAQGTDEEAATPKKRTRTRKTAAEKDADKAAEAAEGEGVVGAGVQVSRSDGSDDASDGSDAAPVKRTRTRRTKAKQEDEADAPTDAQTAESMSEVQASTGSADATEAGAASESTDRSSDEEGAQDKKAQKRAVRTHQIKGSKDRQDSSQQNLKFQNGRNQQTNGNGRNQNHRSRRNRDNRQQREYVPSVSKEELEELKLPELREKAAELSVDASGMKKAEMIDAIYEALAIAEGFIEVCGILDILADGYGFLRTKGYLPSERDVYVGLSTIRRNGLRKGDYVTGQTRPAREGEKFAAIQKVFTINGVPIDEIGHRPKFSDLTPVFPDERFVMEHGKETITSRVIDLVAPIGKGQRGLIVSPPKAGKTTVLKDIAASITANNPEAHLMCLLVDERPEEVTDIERSIHGEVIASTFDMPADNHIAVSELVIERAKRLVEQGEDVVILLDSITRLARAYNLAQPASGRILSGGVDSTALYPPKRFLGAARNIENGGSLTILASALIDTGSKMDEVIFEEFKGTGNMELKLDRNLADRRIFPAIDPVSSGTRKEEILLDSQEAPLIWAVRRILANMNNTERSMDMLIKSLKQTNNNQEFLLRTAKRAQNQGRFDENVEL